MSNSSKILVYVDCSDGTPVDGVRVESDGIVGEVIKKVRDMRAMYHVDCSKVKVFSGSTQVLPGERIEKVLANDSGGGCSDQNPLKLEFHGDEVQANVPLDSALVSGSTQSGTNDKEPGDETANPKKRKRKGSESLDSLQDIIGASSSFAKGNNWYGKQFTLHRQGHPIKCHRPAEFCGSHVSLYYEGFDTFTTECQSVSLDATDTTFVMRFCKEMASPYDNEDERMQIVREHLSAYLAFEGGYSVQEIRRMDGAITVDSVPVLIIEGKKEVGVGGCDSYMEVVAYYCNELTKKATYLRAPCFLVEIVGPHIAISGAVKVNYVMVDRLTDFMWMVPLPNNRPAMTRLAKVFKALKNALASLIQLYDCPKRKPQPQFPYFRIINDVGKIVYTEEIKQDVFIGELEKNSGDSFTVIVKFVEQYCIDAHRLMASKGYAPSVITFEKVTSRYHVVVMEYVEDAVTLHEYIQKEQNRKHSIDQLKDHCSKALCVLHESGFCHGDLRGNNILVKRKETAQPIVIVDFDWSGKNGVAKYPLFMNHIDLTWPEGATDGKFLHPDHDKYWIKQIFDNK